MTRFVASFSALAGAGGADPVPHRDLVCFFAALVGLLCLFAAALVWIEARRHGWPIRLKLHDD